MVRGCTVVAALASLAPFARAAHADSLAELLRLADAANLELREQAARVDEADGLTRVERSGLYPSLTLRADYLRNSDAVVVDLLGDDDATIAARDQFDGALTVRVPLLDLETRSRVVAADAEADVRRAAAAAAGVDVKRAVVIAYYRWVGGTALVAAAQVADRTARDTAAIVEQRRAGGFASPVDIARARAEIARAHQRLADAQLVVAQARRELHTLTGRDIAGTAPQLPDDVAAEAALEHWFAASGAQPDVRAAEVANRAAAASVAQSSRAWLPVVEAFAIGRASNAPGFYDPASWAAGVMLAWRLDLRTLRATRLARARQRLGEVRLARAVRDARDRVTDAWNVVAARRAGVEAASAEVAAAREALSVAQTRIAGGLATPLELLEAQRDAFAADVAVVQARADLAAARALLRLAAGREVAP